MQFTILATALVALLPFAAAKPVALSSPGHSALVSRANAVNYVQCVGTAKKIALTFDDGYVFPSQGLTLALSRTTHS